jgi:hypothetical protein
VIELSIESQWSSDEENSEEDKTLAEDRKVFLDFRKVITAHEWDNWEECDEGQFSKMTERFPVTREEENETRAEEQCSEDRNNESKTSRASVSLFFLYISKHDLVLFLCDNLTREPTIEEVMYIHAEIVAPSWPKSKEHACYCFMCFTILYI